MSMIQNIQNFRSQVQAIIDSQTEHKKGAAILQVAMNRPHAVTHPGAAPHIITEALEQAGALADRDRFKQALTRHPGNLMNALTEAYLLSFSEVPAPPEENKSSGIRG